MSFTFPPPTWEIKSPRLVIRTTVDADAETFVSLMHKPENQPQGETEFAKVETVDEKRARLARWRTTASEGRNAFLAVALRDKPDQVVGYMGFNTFRTRAEAEHTEPERDGPPLPGVEGRYLTDVGVNIDSEYQRKGFAREVMAAVVEYSLNGPLGCEIVRIETAFANEKWRGLMNAMGLNDTEASKPLSFTGYKNDGYVWEVNRVAWEKAKASMVASGTWPL
ncbi:hypothetical protein BX600DRAFT_436281 [Xylariales sp. PMI_506]|nr:hypothetical protein BX600DRAFT_436281 [Xylariales sp. PMI_506]